MNKFLAILIFSVLSSLSLSAQDKIALKTNLLYGGLTLSPNLGLEIGLGRHTTLDVSGSYNWFNLKGTSANNKKLVHWIVQPEFRYFLCERFNGHFFGFHAIASMYNIGGHELPLLFEKGSEKYRYEGLAYGAGFSYGYQLPLANRWNLEFNLGVGYMRMEYDRYDCITCGSKIDSKASKNYFGPTKAGITIIFLL